MQAEQFPMEWLPEQSRLFGFWSQTHHTYHAGVVIGAVPKSLGGSTPPVGAAIRQAAPLGEESGAMEGEQRQTMGTG